MKYTIISVLFVMSGLMAGCGNATPKPAVSTDANPAAGVNATRAKSDPNVPPHLRRQMGGSGANQAPR